MVEQDGVVGANVGVELELDADGVAGEEVGVDGRDLDGAAFAAGDERVGEPLATLGQHGLVNQMGTLVELVLQKM